MVMRLTTRIDLLAPGTGIWNGLASFETEYECSTVISMDRTSGIGMTYAETHLANTWAVIWGRNTWLSAYLPLLALPHCVTDVARLDRLRGGNYVSVSWRRALLFNKPTISALRALLSSVPAKGIDEARREVFFKIKWYIDVSPQVASCLHQLTCGTF